MRKHAFSFERIRIVPPKQCAPIDKIGSCSIKRELVTNVTNAEVRVDMKAANSMILGNISRATTWLGKVYDVSHEYSHAEKKGEFMIW